MAKQGDTEHKAAERAARQSGGGAAAGGHGARTMAALYAEARRRDIPGRSKMSKAALERALA